MREEIAFVTYLSDTDTENISPQKTQTLLV